MNNDVSQRSPLDILSVLLGESPQAPSTRSIQRGRRNQILQTQAKLFGGIQEPQPTLFVTGNTDWCDHGCAETEHEARGKVHVHSTGPQAGLCFSDSVLDGDKIVLVAGVHRPSVFR